MGGLRSRVGKRFLARDLLVLQRKPAFKKRGTTTVVPKEPKEEEATKDDGLAHILYCQQNDYCLETMEFRSICPCHQCRVDRELTWDWNIGPLPFPCPCEECKHRREAEDEDGWEDAVDKWRYQLRGEF